jgi:ABC-type Co2+ transport system permease subunit
MLVGMRTYLVAALVAALPSLTEWLGGVNWVEVLTNLGVPQQWVIPLAGIVSAVVMAVMRKVTGETVAQAEKKA